MALADAIACAKSIQPSPSQNLQLLCEIRVRVSLKSEASQGVCFSNAPELPAGGDLRGCAATGQGPGMRPAPVPNADFHPT